MLGSLRDRPTLGFWHVTRDWTMGDSALTVRWVNRCTMESSSGAELADRGIRGTPCSSGRKSIGGWEGMLDVDRANASRWGYHRQTRSLSMSVERMKESMKRDRYSYIAPTLVLWPRIKRASIHEQRDERRGLVGGSTQTKRRSLPDITVGTTHKRPHQH